MAKSDYKSRIRISILIFTFLAAFGYMIYNVGEIQLVRGQELKNKAFEQQAKGRILTPKRGIIFDRNGKELAISVDVDTVGIDPRQFRDNEDLKEEASRYLSLVLELDGEEVLRKMNRNTSYELLKAKTDKGVGDEIRGWMAKEDIRGIYVDNDSKRMYPCGNLACHVLGFTGTDNYGLDGVEAIMENRLKGMPGKILSEVDLVGRIMPFTEERIIDTKNGSNVVLTIDETIQYMVEKTLEQAILENDAKGGGMAIVMDPSNGDVLAMTTKPDFNLNDPFAPPPGIAREDWKGTTGEDIEILQSTLWRNRVVSDTYEPGSTFKAITTAAVIEENAIRPDTPVICRPVEVQGHTIGCWREEPHGAETFEEAMYNSCNPVFIEASQKIGVETFYRYFNLFGLNNPTGISLPGEAMETIVHRDPQVIDMAVASFGQRFQITPIQMLNAYNVIANGGYLYKPRLVKELRDDKGNITEKFEPEVIRQVISQETAKTVAAMLEGAISTGTGRNAYVPGYWVAGKTGTSETLTEDRYIASFAAFAPYDDPVISILIILDNPKGESHMGGLVAAPVAQKMIEDILTYLGVEKVYSARDLENMKPTVTVPNLINLNINRAIEILEAVGLKYRIEEDEPGKDDVISEQSPQPGINVQEGSLVMLHTLNLLSRVSMPDLSGLEIKEATSRLLEEGLNINIVGEGVAVKQEYEPDAMVDKGTVVTVEFKHLDNIE